MLAIQLTSNFFLFFVGLTGIVFYYQRSVIVVLMHIELLLLSVNLNFIVFSVYLNDFYGQIFSLFILTIAAAESAIGLAILIVYYRIRGKISINQNSVLKG